MAEPPALRYVALLRGVNVGGVIVKNAQLLESLEREGLGSVRAVLASGNVAFDAPGAEPEDDLVARIGAALLRDLGREVPFVLEPQERLRSIAAAYPFERDDAVLHPYVVFSADSAALAGIVEAAKGLALDTESVLEGDGVVYWQVPKGSTLGSPYAKVLAAKRFARHLTTRNLRTVERLAKA